MKHLAAVGDALINAAATLATLRSGPDAGKSIRVRNSLLAEAVRLTGIKPRGRYSSHEIADIYEAVVGYAYLNSIIAFEEIHAELTKLLSSGSDQAAYIGLLSYTVDKIRSKGEWDGVLS